MPRKSRAEVSESSESTHSEESHTPEVSEEESGPGKAKRSFTGIDPERGVRHGRYRAKSSHAAAVKLYGKKCQALEAAGEKIPRKMNVYVVETTRDSKRRVYGYVGRRNPVGGKPSVVYRHHKELIPSVDKKGRPAVGEDGQPILGEDGKPITDDDGGALMIRIPYLNKTDLPDKVIEWKEEVTDSKGRTKMVRRREVISRRAGDVKCTVHCFRPDLRALPEIPDEVYEIANPPRGKKAAATESGSEEEEEEEASEEVSPPPKKSKSKKSSSKSSKKKTSAK